MLVQISERSATVTPYGSVAQVHNFGTVGGLRSAVQARSNKLVWHRICNLLLAWRNGAKTKLRSCPPGAQQL